MRGGFRQNAGRKQGVSSKNAEEARRMLSEMVMKELGPIGKALITKAKKGDIPAIKELFDRAFGRASQNIALDTSDRVEGVNITFHSSFNKEKELTKKSLGVI